MDNSDQNVDPQGGEDVTSSQGQSTEGTQATTEESERQGVQKTEQDQVTDQEQGAEQNDAASDEEKDKADVKDAFPWEGDERFKGKTPEDMFKIVSEADTYKGELSKKAKIADLLSEKFGVTPDKMEEMINKRDQEAKEQFYKDNPSAPVMEQLDHVTKELAEQKQQALVQQEDQKLDKFLNDNSQYAGYREDIRRLGYSIESESDWGQIAEKYFGKAITQGQEDAYQKMGTKQMTQSSGVSKTESKGKPTLEDFSKMSTEEMEAYIA